jgi:hypothetical protein
MPDWYSHYIFLPDSRAHLIFRGRRFDVHRKSADTLLRLGLPRHRTEAVLVGSRNVLCRCCSLHWNLLVLPLTNAASLMTSAATAVFSFRRSVGNG